MINLVQELIWARPSRGWLHRLETEYKIKAVHDDGLVSLKYDQIESPMAEPIVQQCRGMVVDTVTSEVVAWPYNKFWNLGEAHADFIDWSSARVNEKLDGSLMLLYWHPRTKAWRVASSGHPTAGGSFGSAKEQTFCNEFWRLWLSLGYRLPIAQLRALTFMFELCGESNRIVVKHDSPRLVLHGARELLSGHEAGQQSLEDIAGMLDCELVQSYLLGSAADCVTAAAALNPVAAEGFVVVDAAFHRVKIKSPRYVALHHMKCEFSRRRAIELWQAGETSELVAHFPELATEINDVSNKLEHVAHLAEVDFTYANAAAGADRKAFADRIKDRPWAAVCFRLYTARGFGSAAPRPANARALLRAQSTASLERLVGCL